MNNYDIKLRNKTMKGFLEVCSTRSIPLIKQFIKDNNIILEDLTDKYISKIISTINQNLFQNIDLIQWEFKNLNISNNMKYNILQDAILDNHLEIVEYLSISDTYCKSQLEILHYNIFYVICSKGYLDMAKFLIDYQYNNDLENSSLIKKIYDYNDIILEAASNGFLDMLKYFITISNKFNKDYFRLLLKQNIIRVALTNNHINITQYIIDIWGIEECPTYLIEIFQDCIIKNCLNAIKFIHNIAKAQCSDNYFTMLVNNAKLMFKNNNINLTLPTLEYLYITFMNIDDIEENNHDLIKNIFIYLNNDIYTTANNNTIYFENLKIKLIWFSSLSDKYTIVFDDTYTTPPRLTITCPILQAIRSNNILEACNLLNLNQITIEDNTNYDFDCNICLDNKNHSIITTCNHHFCLNCIYEWLIINGNTKCPYCRSDISMENFTSVFL